MSEIEPGRLEALRRCAEEARGSHYGPYSKLMILAAVEASDGTMCSGSNVEIANYSLTKHAEEMAILIAIRRGGLTGRRWLKALYVAGGAPCGSCRQFALEFATEEAICVIDDVSQTELRRPLVDSSRLAPPKVKPLRDLLPDAFEPGDVLG